MGTSRKNQVNDFFWNLLVKVDHDSESVSDGPKRINKRIDRFPIFFTIGMKTRIKREQTLDTQWSATWRCIYNFHPRVLKEKAHFIIFDDFRRVFPKANGRTSAVDEDTDRCKDGRVDLLR